MFSRRESDKLPPHQIAGLRPHQLAVLTRAQVAASRNADNVNSNINCDINHDYHCKVRDKDNVNLISDKYNVNIEPNIKIDKPRD